VLPFQLTLQPGTPVHEQLAFAARKAIVSGRFRPGDAFPSVRTLSRELKIHANTAQKAIAQLKQEGLLEVHPGIGTIVARPIRSSRSERLRILKPLIDQLTVETIRMGLSLEELQRLMAENWHALMPEEVPVS